MLLTLENFTKSYGEKTLFSGVDFSIDDVDVDSVGGCLNDEIGTEPRVGRMAAYGGHAFYVEEVDGVRITRVLIHRASDLAEEHDEIVDMRED